MAVLGGLPVATSLKEPGIEDTQTTEEARASQLGIRLKNQVSRVAPRR